MNFIITTLFIASCIIAFANCADYFRIEGRTYHASYPEKRNWYQARRFCTAIGTLLIDVPNENENVRIRSVINQTETKYNLGRVDWWTSGTDLGSENSFYWDATGDPLTYTDWQMGEPSNDHGLENCIHFFRDPPHKWNDRDCLAELYFICRDPIDLMDHDDFSPF